MLGTQNLIENSEHCSLFSVMRLKFCLVVIGVVLLLGINGCSPAPTLDKHVLQGTTMGTYYRVTLFVEDSSVLAQLSKEIDATLEEVNQSMSTYIADSEVSRFNALEPGEFIDIQASTQNVIEEALRISRLTDGHFDITVAPLVELWGFGPSGQITKQPSREVVTDALARVGYQGLQLDGNRLTKITAGLGIDLSAIAKGFAIDQVANLLVTNGFDNWLIEVGGELRGSGSNLEKPWRIAIETPTLDGTLEHVVALCNEAIATSGDYRNFVEIDGQRYSHAIDASTGYPVRNRIASASVMHASAMTADALATALLVMQAQEAERFARAHQLDVYLILRSDDADSYSVIKTGEFATFCQ